MKSLHREDIAGNIKLRGKLEKTLSCLCCDVKNFKWSERIKQATKEIKEYNETTLKEPE